ALSFATNYLGICGIEGIKKLGMQMPDDIALASFDEHDLFRLHDPGITCISQPIDRIARKVVDILVTEMESETGEDTQLMLPPKLVIRGSSTRPEEETSTALQQNAESRPGFNREILSGSFDTKQQSYARAEITSSILLNFFNKFCILKKLFFIFDIGY